MKRAQTESSVAQSQRKRVDREDRECVYLEEPMELDTPMCPADEWGDVDAYQSEMLALQALVLSQQHALEQTNTRLEKTTRKLAAWRQGITKPIIGNRYTIDMSTQEMHGWTFHKDHAFTFLGKVRGRKHIAGYGFSNGVRTSVTYSTPGTIPSHKSYRIPL